MEPPPEHFCRHRRGTRQRARLSCNTHKPAARLGERGLPGNQHSLMPATVQDQGDMSQMPPRAASGRVNTLLPSYCISSVPHSLSMCHCAAGNGQTPSTVGQKGRNSLLEEAPFPCSGTELGLGLAALGELHPPAPHAFSSLSPAKLTCRPPAQLPCSASDPAVRPGL